MKSKYKVLIFAPPTNKIFRALDISSCFYGAGWIENYLESSKLRENYNLFYCSFVDIKNIREGEMDNVHFIGIPDYSFKSARLSKKTKNCICKIIDEIKPDLIHIFGTDRPHCNFILEKYPFLKILFSFTGFVSEISELYFCGLSKKEIIRNFTFGDLIRKKTILNQQKAFARKGNFEKNILEKGSYFAGRTDWDNDILKKYNKKAEYFFLNECLRNGFYLNKGSWRFDECERFTIFMTSGSYPIKGLHLILEGFKEAKKIYPNICLKIAGPNICKHDTLSSKIRYTNYGKIINKLIKKMNLEGSILFLGLLDEEALLKMYKKANIYLMGSNIENSSNSLAEAMMIGVPTISTTVCGLASFFKNRTYPFLFDLLDKNSLKAAIINVFSMKISELSKICKESEVFISNYFSYQKMEKNANDIYKEIICDKK